MNQQLERLNENKFRLEKETLSIKHYSKSLSKKSKIYKRLCQHISWVNLLALNMAFILAVFLEVIFSYELYLDFGSRGILGLVPPEWVANFLIILVVLFAAIAAHHLRLFLYDDLRKIEEILFIDKNYSENEARMLVRKKSIKGAIIGLIIGGFILTGIYLASLERVSLLSTIDESLEFSHIEVFLPVIMVFLEIVVGCYVAIGIRLLSLKITIRSLKSKLRVAEHNKNILERIVKSYEDLINNPDKGRGNDEDEAGDFSDLVFS